MGDMNGAQLCKYILFSDTNALNKRKESERNTRKTPL